MTYIASGVSTVAGIGLGAWGASLKASQAKQQRAEALDAAQLAALDTDAVTRAAQSGELSSLPLAQQLATQVGTFDQGRLLAQEEQALPGVGAARSKALENVFSLLGDDASWLQGVQRRGAALGLSHGVGGSAFGNVGTLRLSDQESQARKAQGTGLLGSLLSGLRIAQTPSVQTFMAPSPAQLINIRASERAAKQNLLAHRAGMATPQGVWGGFISQLGGTLLGAGMAGATGGASAIGGMAGSTPPIGTTISGGQSHAPGTDPASFQTYWS